MRYKLGVTETRPTRVRECENPAETRALGRALGALLERGAAIGLLGDLGAGKTLFVQGLAEGLGVPAEQRVTSPTFTIVNAYTGGRLPLFHADLYRIEQSAELNEIGLEELCGATMVFAVEWADRFPVLPPDRLEVQLEVTGPESRRVTLRALGPDSAALLGRLAF